MFPMESTRLSSQKSQIKEAIGYYCQDTLWEVRMSGNGAVTIIIYVPGLTSGTF